MTTVATRPAPTSGYAPSAPRLSFAACFVYAPRAAGTVADASRQLCERVKAVDPVWLPRYVGQVVRATGRDSRLATLLAANCVLVPVPSSRLRPAAEWAALQVALCLAQLGFGSRVWPALWRRFPVRKSATAAAGQRPLFKEHYASFAVSCTLEAPGRLVLVDDVISAGRTILAAAARLQERFPDTDVRGFALIRTLGGSARIDRVLDVRHGFVRWAGGDARREP